MFGFVQQYCQTNEIHDQGQIGKIINRLINIRYSNVGIIELSHDLDIETVTEIFIRINSQGVVLSQADFDMSKIAVNESYNGVLIRKTIDYFCHIAKNPSDYSAIQSNDDQFSNSSYLERIKWIRSHSDSLYIPDYSDLLRVAFTSKFFRGKLSNLVSLLSGRDFETRVYKEEIAQKAFKELEEGVLSFVNETNFKRYLMIVKSAGIIDKSLIRSQHSLNFGYMLYLLLKSKKIDQAIINKVVRKWLVLSILTGCYSGSPESMFEFDIKRFNNTEDVDGYVKNIEEGELSAAYWSNILVSRLNTSVASSPYFNLFLMAQIKSGDRGFLSKEVEVKNLIEERGDIHHIFPKKYLQRNGYNNRSQYNQIANYAYTLQEINITIKDKSPKEYMEKVIDQCENKSNKFGEIQDLELLQENLEENCLPTEIHNMDYTQYEEFLQMRRKLMALKIKEFYFSL